MKRKLRIQGIELGLPHEMGIGTLRKKIQDEALQLLYVPGQHSTSAENVMGGNFKMVFCYPYLVSGQVITAYCQIGNIVLSEKGPIIYPLEQRISPELYLEQLFYSVYEWEAFGLGGKPMWLAVVRSSHMATQEEKKALKLKDQLLTIPCDVELF